MSRGPNEEGEGVLREGVPGRGKSQGKSPEAGMCKEAQAAVAGRQGKVGGDNLRGAGPPSGLGFHLE